MGYVDECTVPEEQFDPESCCPDRLIRWAEDGRHSRVRCNKTCPHHRDYREEKDQMEKLFEKPLFQFGGFIDTLEAGIDSVTIKTVDMTGKVVGSVTLQFDHVPTREEIEAIEGFYMQGAAAVQRRMSAVRQIFLSSSEPIIIAGPGEGPKPETPTEEEG